MGFRFGDDAQKATEIARDPFGYDAAVARRNPRLQWSDARGAHDRVIDEKGVLGSAEGADVVVDDPMVSRLHAELDPRPEGLLVRDLGSRNGTFVEGIRVVQAFVPEGARLRVGGIDLRVTYTPEATHATLWPDEHFGPLIGPSPAMREMFARLARAAATDATVLIHGETGTGKELVARAIHDASPRGGGPLITVDCGALPENLLENELFGHVRGAFTGADTARAGAIESAEGGTLFLDEIGELPLAMQPRLLRALEGRTVRRLGETQHRKVDVRFITATHRDLRAMVNTRAFREDLYFRLAVLPITVPPLRARAMDIPALVRRFVPGEDTHGLSPGLLRELSSRPWLGNVRELRNFVERAAAFGAHEALAMDDATRPGPSSPMGHPVPTSSLPPGALDVPFKDLRDQTLETLEREYVRGLLQRHGRNVTAVAQASGLNRTYVHRLIRRHAL